MNISMFTSWQVRCGIASYTSLLVDALNKLDETRVNIVPFDRQAHPRSDYEAWGRQMNDADVAHIQHEYAFFGYLLPWKNHLGAMTSQIQKPLVITRHVSFDGPLMVQGSGLRHKLWQAKWTFYNTRLNPYATHLNKDTFEVAQQIIVLSKRLKDHLIARGIAERKVHVIPPGTPEVTNTDRDEALRKSWGWAGKRIVCQFGFVAPAKGHLQALDAFAQLPEDYVYLIAGGTRLESHSAFVDQIKERSRVLGISHRVHITGFLAESDIARYIASSDVLIFPNTQVDFSYSLITAIAYRSTPIIASDLYAHREVASECEGVALYKAGDPAQLAREIMRVCSEGDKRRKMIDGLNAYAQSHTWRNAAERTREVYEMAIRR